jgi:hypothetical protein
MSSTELVDQRREVQWPPGNAADLIAFFTEKERADPAFKGMAACAEQLVQSLIELGRTTEEHVIAKGNKIVDLNLLPEGRDTVNHASYALIFAAHAMTEATLAETSESPKGDRSHAIHIGQLPVHQNGEVWYLPVAFKEIYKLDDKGNVVSVVWSGRTNYPQREQVERANLEVEPVLGDERLAWGQNVLLEIGCIEVKEIPPLEDRYPKAA